MELRIAAATLAGVSLACGASAQDHHDHEHETRSADAHVHGAAQLAIAAEGVELAFELQSAMHNVVGFEHAPHDDAERQALETATAHVLDGVSLFLPNPEAGCTFTYVQSTLGDVGDEDDHANDHDEHDAEHDDHDASEHHDEEGHADHHEDEHGEHAHEEGVYKDLTATYMFTCENPEALNSIYVGLFDQFERLETIDVTFLGESLQTAAELTPGSPVLDLK